MFLWRGAALPLFFAGNMRGADENENPPPLALGIDLGDLVLRRASVRRGPWVNGAVLAEDWAGGGGFLRDGRPGLKERKRSGSASTPLDDGELFSSGTQAGGFLISREFFGARR